MTEYTKEAWENFETLCLAFMERASNIYLSKERIRCDSLLPEAMKQEINDILKARRSLYDAIEDEIREKCSERIIIFDWMYDVCTPIDCAVTIYRAICVDLEITDERSSRPSIYDGAKDISRWIGLAKDNAKHIIDSL